MDLRPLYVLLCVLAVGAGVVVGWLEAGRSPGEPGRPDGLPDALKDPLAEILGEGDLPAEPEPEPAEPPDGGPAEVSPEDTRPASPAMPGAGETGRAEARQPPEPTRKERQALEDVRERIRAQEFEAAERAARELADRAGAAARRDARRLAAKARVFGALVPEEGAGRSGADRVWEVRLANGNTVLATRAEKTPEVWVLELPSGISWSPAREDVLEVKPTRADDFRAKRRKAIDRMVESVDHPIDLYVRGVVRYYRDGFPERGFRLLERLLDVAGSEELLRLFAPEDADAEALVEDWLLAAGRGVPEATHEPSGDRTGARTDRVSSPGDDTSEGAAERGAAAGPPSPPSSPPADADATRRRVERLIGEATGVFRNAFREEGREDELREAYERLREAQELLARLPDGPGKRELRREVGQLIFDVGRALPFEG